MAQQSRQPPENRAPQPAERTGAGVKAKAVFGVELRTVDDRGPSGTPDGPRAIVVSSEQVNTLSDGDQVNLLDEIVHGVFVGLECKECDRRFLAQLEENGVESHERGMGAEVMTHWSNEYTCDGCGATVGGHLVLSEYPAAIVGAFDIEGEMDGQAVRMAGVEELVDCIRDAQPFAYSMKRSMEETQEWLNAVGQEAPSLVAGMKALRAAMERSVALFGSYGEGRAVLEELETLVKRAGKDGIIVERMARNRGEAVRDKSRRAATMCSTVLIHDGVPSGHLNEIEMAISIGKPVAILQAGARLTTLMLDGTEGDNVKVFRVAGDLHRAVNEALAWADRFLAGREARVVKPEQKRQPATSG